MAEQYQNRAESRKSDLRAQLESDAYINNQVEQWNAGRRPDWWTEEMADNAERNGLSEASIVVERIRHQLGLIHFDNIYYQYNQGLLDEAFWQGSLLVIESMMNNPLNRAVWVNDVFRRPIIDVVEELTKESN